MILVVASNKDIAAMNIAKHLIQNYPFTKTTQTFQENPIYTANINNKTVTYITINQEAVNSQDLPEAFPKAELIVFVSRHSSLSGTPTLSVHTPGNFASAELGGLPRAISISPANAMLTALKTLKQLQVKRNLSYEVSYECTHHGPSLNVPTMFVELGSSPTQWNDSEAAAVVSEAAVQAIKDYAKVAQPAALGIGGTHYNGKFTNMALQGEAVFGHMIPKYVLSQIDAYTLRQCREKTIEKVETAILDWKGIKSQDKTKLITLLQEIDLPIKKI